MKIIGTTKEIEWMKEAIQNNCEHCPYLSSCNESAKRDSRLYGTIKISCKDFLGKTIEFIEIDDI